MRHIAYTFQLLANMALSQSWCPPQAAWHHAFYDASGTAGYVHTEYTGDTVVDGSMCQKLRSVLHGYDQQMQTPVEVDFGLRITQGQSDLVRWVPSGDTLYWFGASPGDRWDAGDGIHLTVVDTGTMAIDAIPLRFLVVGIDELPWWQQDTIVERLGFLHYYWDGQGSFINDAGFGGLRCYSDVQIDFNEGPPENCTFILSAPSQRALLRPMIAPNPASDDVTLVLGGSLHGTGMVVVYDAVGVDVLRYSISAHADRFAFSTTFLAPALYHYQVHDPSGIIGGGKLIVDR